MEIHIKRVMSCSGTSRKVTIYTPDGSGPDGQPAIVYDSGFGMISLKADSPPDPSGLQHLQDALLDIQLKMLASKAGIAYKQGS